MIRNTVEEEAAADNKSRKRRAILDCELLLKRKYELMSGGSQDGKFIVLSQQPQAEVPLISGDSLAQGRWIVLEVGGTKVSGFTLQEVFYLIKRIHTGCEDQSNRFDSDSTEIGNGLVGFKIVPSKSTFEEGLTEDIREFLSLLFKPTDQNDTLKSLQKTIREHLYSRTVPCTTRPPRPDETPGQDYIFMSLEQFMLSEKNGDLLETGFYRGHFYGTPRPGSLDQPSLAKNDSVDFNGEFITVRLSKKEQGFGFTIVGGSGKYDDFLQIKTIIANSTADQCGQLRKGDVLMYVNDTCVLGYSHSEVVKLFHTIKSGDVIELTVCRPPACSTNTDEIDALDKLLAKMAPPTTASAGAAATNTNTAFYDNSLALSESTSIRKVDVLKGVQGFGFTIVDCLNDGQRIKQIFDKERCQGLYEGDLLLKINNVDVGRMEHNDLVQMLKQFPIGNSCTFEVDSRCSRRGSVNSSPRPSSCNHLFNRDNFSPIPYSADKPPKPMKYMQVPSVQAKELRPSFNQRSVSVDICSNGSSNRTFSGDREFGNELLFPSVVRDTIDLNITLQLPNGPMYNDSGAGFGFRIVGGKEEGTQVSVGHIVPMSVAAADGRLFPGDEIIEIDGFVVVNASHARVVDLILQSRHRGILNMTVRRPRSTPKYPFNCTLRKTNVHESFGFVILSSIQTHSSIIGRVIERTSASASGLLSVGDRILAVNGIRIDGMAHRDVVSLIKSSGTSITLTIGAPSGTLRRRQQSSIANGTGSLTMTTTAAAAMMNRPATARIDSNRSGSLDSHTKSLWKQNTLSTIDRNKWPTTTHKESTSIYDKLPLSSNEQIIVVDIPKAWNGYGFSIRGGHEYGLPLFVLKIAAGGPAHMNGRIQPGDQIIEINGHRTLGMSHQDAIKLIKNGEESVNLKLLRRAWKHTPLATDET